VEAEVSKRPTRARRQSDRLASTAAAIRGGGGERPVGKAADEGAASEKRLGSSD